MHHDSAALRKRPRDEAGSDAGGWTAAKQARRAWGWPTPGQQAALATPTSLSKSRPRPAVAFLSTVSPKPCYGGARDVHSFAAQWPPLAATPASLSKGLPCFADGFYAMSSATATAQPPPTSGLVTSVQRAPPPTLPPMPQMARGFAASKLGYERPSADPQGYLDFVQLYQQRRPDAAPVEATLALRSSLPEPTASAPVAAAIACAEEKLAALQPFEKDRQLLDRRLVRALEPPPREASRQREIIQAEAQAERLAAMRLPPPATNAGLEPLTEEQMELATSALLHGVRSEVLAAKSFKSFGDLDVTRQHFLCMREGEWLNDEVINFYLGLLQERELRLNAKQPRVHFHNTFFYNKLYADSRDYNYKSVARWTSEKKLGYCIMNCDLVCIPVHQEVHWVLAVIDIKRREVRYYDSLGGVDRSCMANLLRYITDEAKHKLDATLDVSEWKQIAPKDIPEQRNGCDCGVFMVKFADWLARQSEWTFSQSHMPYFRKRIIAEVRQKVAN